LGLAPTTTGLTSDFGARMRSLNDKSAALAENGRVGLVSAAAVAEVVVQSATSKRRLPFIMLSLLVSTQTLTSSSSPSSGHIIIEVEVETEIGEGGDNKHEHDDADDKHDDDTSKDLLVVCPQLRLK